MAVSSDATLMMRALTSEQRKAFVHDTVVEVAHASLGLKEMPPLDEPLQSLGIDSIGAVEFRNALSARLGIRLPATSLFDYPTLTLLIDFINSQLAKQFVGYDSELTPPLSPVLTFRPAMTDRGLAVISAACDFPGGASSPAKFWEVLEKGTDCMDEIPLTRWNSYLYYDKDPDALDTSYAKLGAFIDNVHLFDNSAFNISPAEAKVMDPQQRLMLEVAQEAFARAKMTRKTLSGGTVGCFIGCCNMDWHMVNVPSGPFTGENQRGTMLLCLLSRR